MKAQIEALQSMLDVPEPAPVPKPVKPVTPVEIEEDTFVIVRETIAPLEDQLSPITDIDSLTIPSMELNKIAIVPFMERLNATRTSAASVEMHKLTDTAAIRLPMAVNEMAVFIGSTPLQTKLVYAYAPGKVRKLTPLQYVHLLVDDLFQRKGLAGMISEEQRTLLNQRAHLMDLADNNASLTPTDLNILLKAFGIDDFTDDELMQIVRGEGMGSPKVTIGTAAAFGGVTKELKAMGIPTLCCTDGPSGMRLDSGKKAFSLPNGTCLASTFNVDLVEELYSYLGIEMLSNKIDALLGPGINIHRHPLNGRNFEYFSEDPLLTGLMAVAQVKALEKSGVTPVIKHFCANNRETNRREMSSTVSSRALREIYLPAFEIAIREGGCRCLMTSYNRINDIYSANHYDQNTMVLREQWGFTGLVMTDWWAFINKEVTLAEKYSLEDHSVMARSQNDVYMVCTSVEKENLLEADTYKELTEGDGSNITRAELQRNARNILNFAMNTPAMDRVEGKEVKIEHIDSPFKDDDVVVDSDVFYDLDDEVTIECNVKTARGQDFVFGITSKNAGYIGLEFTGYSNLGELAQIPMTLYVTSIPFAVVTWNGTNGEAVSKSVECMMYSKNCVFRAHFQSGGVSIKTLKVKYLRPFEGMEGQPE